MEKHRLFKSDAERIARDMVKYAGMNPCPVKEDKGPSIIQRLAKKTRSTPCPPPRFPPCTPEQEAARRARAMERANAAELARIKAQEALDAQYMENILPQKACPPEVRKINRRGYGSRTVNPYASTHMSTVMRSRSGF